MGVAFSIPTIPSFTSTVPDQAIKVKLGDGSETSQILFVPDIKVIQKFAEGNLGIADSFKKSMFTKNLGKMTNTFQLENFLKSTGSTLPNPPESYVKDGKVQVDINEISMGKASGDLGGLGAMEKALILSIFESQKPYMEIIKIVAELLIVIEDIIARILGVLGSSKKPSGNPKALGYKGNAELQSNLSKLGSLVNLPTGPKSPLSSQSFPQQTTSPGEFGFITQSVVYSTGQFDPSVDYTYVYIDEKDETIRLPEGTSSGPSRLEDILPETVIFGVYDKDWNPIELTHIETPIEEARQNGTLSKNINWIKRSGKWYGEFQQIKSRNVGGNDYTFDRFYGDEGPTVTINDETIYVKKGFPRILNYQILNDYYLNYYLEDAKDKMERKGMTPSLIDSSLEQIRRVLTTATAPSFSTAVDSTLESVIKGGFLCVTETANTIGLTDNIKIQTRCPYKPKKIEYLGKQVWLDPEAKYDMKIIKCDSSFDIKVYDLEGDGSKFVTTKFLRDVRNYISLTLSDNSKFNLLQKRLSIGFGSEIFTDLTEYRFDNFDVNNNYNISIFLPQVPDIYLGGVRFGLKKDGREVKYLDTPIIVDFSNKSFRLGIQRNNEFQELPSDQTSNFLTTVEGLYVLTFPNGDVLLFDEGKNYFGKQLYSGLLSNFAPTSLQIRRVSINVNTREVTQTSEVLPPNSIVVQDDRFKFGRVINNFVSKNDGLATPNPYSPDSYGSPIEVKDKEGNITERAKQSIHQIYREIQNQNDTQTYYIVEGILSSKNNQKLVLPPKEGEDNSGGGSYGLFDVIGAIVVFIELLIEIFSKLIPEIAQLLTVIQNPAKFITDILIAKLGDNFGTENERFGFFGKEFQDMMSKLKDIANKDTPTTNTPAPTVPSGATNSTTNQTTPSAATQAPPQKPEELKKKKLEMEQLIKESKLYNYVSVSPDLVIKFILDGVGSVQLFGDAPILSSLPGFKFGIESKIGTLATNQPEVPLNLIFDFPKPSSQKDLDELAGNENNLGLDNNNQDRNPKGVNGFVANSGDVEYVEEITYSTGEFKKDVDYTYIYVSEYVNDLLKKADEEEQKGNLGKAINLLQDAEKINPNNSSIKDKLEELKNKNGGDSNQPILSFILNLATLPLKVIFGIISYIMDTFMSLFNPFELPIKIINFVSFKWLLDLFNPTSKNSMFAMAGLLFDIETFLLVYLPGLETGIMQQFDLGKIIKLPWCAKLPTYSSEEFRTLIYGYKGFGTPRMLPLTMLNTILCLIEGIINGFIDLVWALLGLGSIIPPPHIKLCKNSNDDLSPVDILDLLNAKYNDKSDSRSTNASDDTESSYDFAYTIKTSDGRDIKDLNEVELQKWVEENKDYQFVFNFTTQQSPN